MEPAVVGRVFRRDFGGGERIDCGGDDDEPAVRSRCELDHRSVSSSAESPFRNNCVRFF